MTARRGSMTVVLAVLSLFALASCLDDSSSPGLACDDLRAAFVAKSESLGCGFGGASYACTSFGGSRCNRAEIDACQGAIDGATDCRSLSGGGNCVLHCE